MSPWRAIISPRLPILGGLLSLLVAAPAQAKEYRVPFVIEAIPGEALIDMTSDTSVEKIMADGTRVRMNDQRNALLLKKYGKTRTIPLYKTYSSITSAKSNSITLTDSDYKNVTMIHLPTGRRTDFTKGDTSYSVSYNNVEITIKDGMLHFWDYKNGTIHSQRTTAKDSNDFKSFSDSFQNTAIQIKGTEGYLLSTPDGNLQTKTYPEKGMAFTTCNGTSGAVRECETASGKWVADFVNGNFRKLEAGDRLEAGHPSESKVLIFNESKDNRGRESGGATFILDLKTGSKKVIEMNETGLATLVSSRGFTLFGSGDATKIILYTKGLFGTGMQYELRSVTPQEFWAALESEKPIDSFFSIGTSLGKDTDLTRLAYATMDQGQALEDGVWRIELLDRMYRIRDSRRPEDSILVGPIPSGIRIQMIPKTGFAKMSSYQNNSSVVFLLDLKSGRTFEAGPSYSDPEYSAETGNFVVRSGYSQILFSLQAFRAYMNSGTRFGVGDRPNGTALDASVVGTCTNDAGAAHDAVVTRLLELRQPGIPVDQNEFMQLLTYRLGPNERAIVAQIFQRYLLEDADHAKLMFRKFKIYDRLEGDSDKLQMNPCIDQYGNQAILAVLDDAVKLKEEERVRAISFNEISHLLVFAPYFKKYGYDEGVRKDNLAERLATGAANHPMANGIFFSKLFYFAKGVIGAIMGHKREFKTDITVLIDGKRVVSQLLSTHPTAGSRAVRSSYGFYMTTVDSFDTPADARAGQTFTHEVKWRSNSREYRADINLTAANDLRDLVPRTASMDHAAIRKDGKITGLMVVGSNLGSEHSRRTVNQYRYFYMEKGYTFLNEYVQDGFVEWMKNKTINGEIDYLIKEAHSDGDEKNLFRAGTKAAMIVGRKASTAPGTPEEVVYLAMPTYEKDSIVGGDELIPNKMFGEWIQGREAAGGGPLVYFNTSCSSFYKVIRETTAARSKLLIGIPSISSVRMFRSSNDNPTGMLITGLLNGEDWATTRAKMDTVPRVKEGTDDVFALPSDAKFDEYIRAALGFAIEDEVKIFDVQTNQLINIDEFNSH